MFVGKRPYDVAPLEEFLKKELSETRTMSSLPPKPRYGAIQYSQLIADVL